MVHINLCSISSDRYSLHTEIYAVDIDFSKMTHQEVALYMVN